VLASDFSSVTFTGWADNFTLGGAYIEKQQMTEAGQVCSKHTTILAQADLTYELGDGIVRYPLSQYVFWQNE